MEFRRIKGHKSLQFRKYCLFTLAVIFSAGALFAQYGYSEEEQIPATNEFLPIYEAAMEKAGIDPLIQNGVFYDNPYYNAKGHPYLGNGTFTKGSVTFRDKRYERVDLKYDIYSQQLILGKESDGVWQMNLLEPAFISNFTLLGNSFETIHLENEASRFYQVVARAGNLSCYYAWYKNRTEIEEPGKSRIFSFSETRRRSMLHLDEEVKRYKNNTSFVKCFPKSSRPHIKAYLKRTDTDVMEADIPTMQHLITFADDVLSGHEASMKDGSIKR